MDIYFALIGMVLILPVACCGIRNLEKRKNAILIILELVKDCIGRSFVFTPSSSGIISSIAERGNLCYVHTPTFTYRVFFVGCHY